jgi:hypothetical protein
MIGLWTSPFYTEDSESLFINLEEKGTFELHNWVGPEYIQKGNWNIINNPMMLRLTFFELDPYWSRDLSNPKLKELAPYIGEYSFDHKYIEFPISYASSENSRKAQCDLDKFNINLFNNLIYKNTL